MELTISTGEELSVILILFGRPNPIILKLKSTCTPGHLDDQVRVEAYEADENGNKELIWKRDT